MVCLCTKELRRLDFSVRETKRSVSYYLRATCHVTWLRFSFDDLLSRYITVTLLSLFLFFIAGFLRFSVEFKWPDLLHDAKQDI